MSALAERSKVNLDLWNLFIAIVTLDQTYQARIMTKGGAIFFSFLKFNQSWCVSYLHEWHMHQHIFFWSPAP